MIFSRLLLISASFSFLVLSTYAEENVADAVKSAEESAKERAEAMLNEVDYLISDNSSVSEIRGIIKPSKQAIISSEIKANITKVYFSVGERFKKGDILIEFDSSVYQSQYNAQLSISKSQEVIYQNQVELLKLDGITETELLLSKLKKQELQAVLEEKKYLLDLCIVKAPYDGIVIEKFVNDYELVTLDKQLLQIIASNDPELEIIVPSSWVSSFESRKQFKFVVDETKRLYFVQVLRTSGIIDAVSKTIKVICKFNEPDEFLVSGMTGTADFTQDQ